MGLYDHLIAGNEEHIGPQFRQRAQAAQTRCPRWPSPPVHDAPGPASETVARAMYPLQPPNPCMWPVHVMRVRLPTHSLQATSLTLPVRPFSASVFAPPLKFVFARATLQLKQFLVCLLV